MTETQEQFIGLIRDAVCNCALPVDFCVHNGEALYELAKNHDMAHLVGYSVQKNSIQGLDEALVKKFQRQLYSAIRRVTILEEEAAKITNVFEEYHLDCIPLKGIVIRKLYPEDWMRVSADIDILVHLEDIKRAEKLLVEKLDYTITASGAHHDHVTAPSGFHVDLHFTLSERKTAATPLLDDVWNCCHLAKGKKHEYIMDDEMLYLFHMFHASVHFLGGGCGVRPVLDTWILNHRVEHDENNRRILMERSGLLRFSEILESIAESWFSGKAASDADDVVTYILTGGVYGANQRIAAAQAHIGSRWKYIVARLFPSYARIKTGYPILNKLPVLLPFCWIHRLIKSAVIGKSKKARKELEESKRECGRSVEIARVFEKMGLI